MIRLVFRTFFFGLFVALASFGLWGEASADQGDCGQPTTDGPSPVATDALFVLGAAVGIQTCDLCVCDVTDDGATTATDALTVLASVVGQMVSINCPSCGGGEGACFESQAPSCGGACEDPGVTCTVDPEDPSSCECLNACEASAAPTCGGSCESEDPEAVCTPLNIDPVGLDPIDVCECLSPDVSFCEDASGPECFGVCSVGSVCESDGGNGCQCSAQPVQPACASATAPACLGTCDDTLEGSSVCESDGGSGCVCAPYEDGSSETCYEAGAPVCGGVCSFGNLCAIDLEGCECVSPCQVSNTPSCGGACERKIETCVVTTITVGGASRDFCECWEID
jgi:hypothetical protein